MSTEQGCNDDSDVVVRFKEALKRRVGDDAFQVWFSGITFTHRPSRDHSLSATSDSLSAASDDAGAQRWGILVALASGQFAADRLSKNYLQAMRGAASAVAGGNMPVLVEVNEQPARQIELPLDSGQADVNAIGDGAGEQRNLHRSSQKRIEPSARQARSRRGSTQTLSAILRDGSDSRKGNRQRNVASSYDQATPLLDQADQRPPNPSKSSAPRLRGGRAELTWESFFAGSCNELARTACKMAIENPALASPLVLWGPAGSGKTHLMNAVAAKLRRLHRMPRVVYLPAEEFTNDFIKALNSNCLPAFRLRFRDADALLIDDIQFFIEKKATIRELHHTIEMMAESGKPLLFAGTKAPNEIKGLSSELSGRLASGLVCQLQPLDSATRQQVLRQYAELRCLNSLPAEIASEIADSVDGDGRLLSGIINHVALLERMYGQMPTMDQIRQHGSHLLQSSGVPITINAIERAVERVFQLDSKSLQSGSQTKSITEPRMLAMYLSREMTSSAFSEIGGHFGGRSHSTAILASQRVRQWLDAGRAIGRGRASLSTSEAIRRIESILKSG